MILHTYSDSSLAISEAIARLPEAATMTMDMRHNAHREVPKLSVLLRVRIFIFAFRAQIRSDLIVQACVVFRRGCRCGAAATSPIWVSFPSYGPCATRSPSMRGGSARTRLRSASFPLHPGPQRHHACLKEVSAPYDSLPQTGRIECDRSIQGIYEP